MATGADSSATAGQQVNTAAQSLDFAKQCNVLAAAVMNIPASSPDELRQWNDLSGALLSAAGQATQAAFDALYASYPGQAAVMQKLIDSMRDRADQINRQAAQVKCIIQTAVDAIEVAGLLAAGQLQNIPSQLDEAAKHMQGC